MVNAEQERPTVSVGAGAVRADTPPAQQQEQRGDGKCPTPRELEQRAEALKKKIDKHLGRGSGA
jgi:hypothetical protein